MKSGIPDLTAETKTPIQPITEAKPRQIPVHNETKTSPQPQPPTEPKHLINANTEISKKSTTEDEKITPAKHLINALEELGFPSDNQEHCEYTIQPKSFVIRISFRSMKKQIEEWLESKKNILAQTTIEAVEFEDSDRTIESEWSLTFGPVEIQKLGLQEALRKAVEKTAEEKKRAEEEAVERKAEEKRAAEKKAREEQNAAIKAAEDKAQAAKIAEQEQKYILNTEWVQELINKRKITAEEARENSTKLQAMDIRQHYRPSTKIFNIILASIINDEITLGDIFNFRDGFYAYLIRNKKENFEKLLDRKKVTLQQLNKCSANQLNILNIMPAPYLQEILDGKVNIDAFLNANTKPKNELYDILKINMSLKGFKFIFDCRQEEKAKEAFNTTAMNELYIKLDKKTLRTGRFAGCLNLFSPNTSEFIDVMDTIRYHALKQLETEINFMKECSVTTEIIIQALDKARDMAIFKDHRSNHYITGAFGRTSAMIQIDQWKQDITAERTEVSQMTRKLKP